MRPMIFIFSFFLVHFLEASTNRVGNGGDGEVCYDAHKSLTTVQLLDFQESDRLMRDDLVQSHEVILRNVLEGLKKVNLKLGSQYEKRAVLMMNELSFRDENLVDIADSKHFLVKAHCEIEQLAIRKNEIAPGEKRFLVNRRLWLKLSESGKAGLLLHEIIYEHFYKLGEDDSLKARKLNSLLFSKEFSLYNANDLRKFFERMKIAIY